MMNDIERYNFWHLEMEAELKLKGSNVSTEDMPEKVIETDIDKTEKGA